jgi:hypothetical protein
MPILLTLKLLLVPSLIGLITLSGRRWGPAVAGWLSAFPVIGGPILFFIATEHGNHFASTAASGTLSAVLAIITFSIAYSWAAMRFAWRGSLFIALIFYAIAVLILNALHASLYVTIIANVLVIAVAPRLFPQISAKIGASDNATTPSTFDLPFRMAVGAILVLLVTYFASSLGPRLSGIFAMFPIMSTVLAAFSHRSAGKEFAIKLLKGMLLGWYAFSAFCFTLSLLLENSSIPIAFTVATITASIVQLTTRRFLTSQ